MNPDLMQEVQAEIENAKSTSISVYDRVKLTRSAGRATSQDYIKHIFTDFCEMHGDRRYGDDAAVIGGIAKLGNMPVTVIGTEKGHDLNERMARNFGCVLPEGYRKALRLVKEAEKFHRPVVFFVDTQGANSGMGAEERGIGEAIAENLYEFGTVRTPMITVMIGEGGSGGALALAVSDEVWMLENAYYSVIAPESCASILFKDPARAPEVSEYLKLTAHDLYLMEVIEKIVREPNDFTDSQQLVKFMGELRTELMKKLMLLKLISKDKLIENRYEKYRKIGRYAEISAEDQVKWRDRLVNVGFRK